MVGGHGLVASTWVVAGHNGVAAVNMGGGGHMGGGGNRVAVATGVADGHR